MSERLVLNTPIVAQQGHRSQITLRHRRHAIDMQFC